MLLLEAPSLRFVLRKDCFGHWTSSLRLPSSSILQILSCKACPCSLPSLSSSCFSLPRTQSRSRSQARNGPPYTRPPSQPAWHSRPRSCNSPPTPLLLLLNCCCCLR